MATARIEILDAFRRLEARTARTAFAPREIIGEVMSTTRAFAEVTIRTYVVSVMCADAPVHHANHTNDLRRVGRGLYALVNNGNVAIASPPPTTPLEPPTPSQDPPLGNQPWYWEGNVQSAVVTGLAAAGWHIRSVADTESRAQGTDVVAIRNATVLHVEVKGYPTDTYVRGDQAGTPKPTHPATQARVWFAGALLKAAMLRNDHPDMGVAIALPSFQTYRSLAARVSLTLNAASVGLIWIQEGGEIEIDLR